MISILSPRAFFGTLMEKEISAYLSLITATTRLAPSPNSIKITKSFYVTLHLSAEARITKKMFLFA